MNETDFKTENGGLPDDSLPGGMQLRRKRVIAALVALAVVAVLAVAAALLVREYVVTTYVVDGESMLPTLDGGVTGDTSDGDTLILNKLGTPDRGDIVVFYYDWNALGDPFFSPHHLVKRVIGLPGDTVEIRDGALYLNGVLQDEDYIKEHMDGRYDGLSVTVPEGHFFVMGDNRNNSTDSRAIGCVPADNIVGVCFLVSSDSGALRIP